MVHEMRNNDNCAPIWSSLVKFRVTFAVFHEAIAVFRAKFRATCAKFRLTCAEFGATCAEVRATCAEFCAACAEFRATASLFTSHIRSADPNCSGLPVINILGSYICNRNRIKCANCTHYALLWVRVLYSCKQERYAPRNLLSWCVNSVGRTVRRS